MYSPILFPNKASIGWTAGLYTNQAEFYKDRLAPKIVCINRVHINET